MQQLSESDFDYIKNLEENLHNPATRSDIIFMNNILSDEFVEIGQSGKFYDKKKVIKTLTVESKHTQYSLSDFNIKVLSPDVVLTLYRVDVNESKSMRSSIWKKLDSKWTMVFHQGTALDK